MKRYYVVGSDPFQFGGLDNAMAQAQLMARRDGTEAKVFEYVGRALPPAPPAQWEPATK